MLFVSSFSCEGFYVHVKIKFICFSPVDLSYVTLNLESSERLRGQRKNVPPLHYKGRTHWICFLICTSYFTFGYNLDYTFVEYGY